MNRHRNILSTGLLALVFAVSLVAAPAGASTWEIDNNHSEVAFQVRHFVTQVRGNFDTFGGTVVMDDEDMASSSVDFWIETATIDTRNDNRDKHLRSADFFEVEKYPRISFESSKIVKTGDDQYDVTGEFTMHGVTKTITLPVTFLGTMTTQRGAKAGFATETVIDRKEYGIVWNQALDAGGAMLSDEVRVEINLELNEKAMDEAAGQ